MTNSGEVIVSCTTTRQRLPMLLYTLVSLQQQSRKPDRIVVNVSREAYLSDEGIDDLPDWLSLAQVEVNWVSNTGPYRKLLPLINECADVDRVVTVDDDVLYHSGWLAALLKLDDSHPDHLVCTRARRMKRGLFGWKSYARWRLLKRQAIGMDLMPTGSGGVLYKRSLLDMAFLNDPQAQVLAPTTDDLWFRMASMRKGTSVLVEPEAGRENIFLKHNRGLEEINKKKKRRALIDKIRGTKSGLNDGSWKRTCRYSEQLD